MRADTYSAGAVKCHMCPSGTLRRSRARAWWEKWRKAMTAKRLYRCDMCDWRGWIVDSARDEPLPPEHPNPTNALPGRGERSVPLDLHALDAPPPADASDKVFKSSNP